MGRKYLGATPSAAADLARLADVPAAGALVLLEQHTASASATLDFTSCISATYDEYRVDFLGIVPATNGAVLQLLASVDGGSTWDTTAAHYGWTEFHQGWAGSGLGYGGNASDSKIAFASFGFYSSGAPAFVAQATLFDPLSASNHKVLIWRGNVAYTDGSYQQITGAGAYKRTSAINAFRFLMSSGNIASGTIRVYGIAK